MRTDRGEVPLFDDVLIAPGQSTSSCVTVETSASSRTNDPRVWFDVAGESALAEHLIVDVVSGTSSRDACVGGEIVATGRLSALLGEDSRWSVDAPTAGLDQRWYRLDVRMAKDAPNELMGARVTGVSVRWAAEIAEASTRSLVERTTVFATGVAERSVIPLLIALAASIGFAGIQSRIDRDDPKLAYAPVDRVELAFTPR